VPIRNAEFADRVALIDSSRIYQTVYTAKSRDHGADQRVGVGLHRDIRAHDADPLGTRKDDYLPGKSPGCRDSRLTPLIHQTPSWLLSTPVKQVLPQNILIIYPCVVGSTRMLSGAKIA